MFNLLIFAFFYPFCCLDNLADYCSEENWSDYPGRHRIRLEKSVKIRRPSIVDFHYNETHRVRMGSPHYKQPYSWYEEQHRIKSHKFVPYCLLSLDADHGYRIYAEGFAFGKFSSSFLPHLHPLSLL